MRIIFITTSLSTGGAEFMLFKLLKELDRTNFEPSVISLRPKGEVGLLIEKLGVEVISLGMRSDFYGLKELPRLYSHLRKLNPDIVQTWMYHADLLGGLTAKLAGIKKIIWGIRNSNLSLSETKRSTLLATKVCALLSKYLPSKILSCSYRAAEIHVAAGYSNLKFHVIPNGFDLEKFKPDVSARQSVRSELNIPADTPLVGLIARYDAQKNHLGFLEAAAIVSRKMPEVNFLLAGNDVDENNKKLINALRDQGLIGRVHLLGRREDMPRIMASLDLLASTSSYGEAFPNVLGEAMACAVPCVATDVGDSAEIIGETGRIVPVGDMRAFSNQIFNLLGLPQTEKSDLGMKARERILRCYEIGSVTRRFEKLYGSILRSN